MEDRGGLYLREVVSAAEDQDVTVEDLSSHSGLIEPVVFAAVNTKRRNKVTDLDGIGGMFGVEDLAVLTTTDGSARAYLDRNGQRYHVNLNKLGLMAA